MIKVHLTTNAWAEFDHADGWSFTDTGTIVILPEGQEYHRRIAEFPVQTVLFIERV